MHLINRSIVLSFKNSESATQDQLHVSFTRVKGYGCSRAAVARRAASDHNRRVLPPAIQPHRAGRGVGPTGSYVAVATGHRRCVGDGVDTRRPGQRPQVGSTPGSGHQVGRRTRSWQETDLGMLSSFEVNV